MRIIFDSYDPVDERRRESLFALGNGVLFVRACPIEVETEDSCHYPGTYHAACYNRRILAVDGETLGHDSLVNLPNWVPLQFRVQGESEWFPRDDVRWWEYSHHLDMAAGLTERRALVRDAAGRLIRLHEQRLVSMARPSLAALHLELTAENWSGVLELRTAIDGTVSNHNTDRHSLPGYQHLDVIGSAGLADHALLLAARTRQSRIDVTVATRLRLDQRADGEIRQGAGLIAEHLACAAATGVKLTIEKLVSVVTSRDPAVAAPDDARSSPRYRVSACCAGSRQCRGSACGSAWRSRSMTQSCNGPPRSTCSLCCKRCRRTARRWMSACPRAVGRRPITARYSGTRYSRFRFSITVFRR
jgi:trehalose/maltose hydrolase-like predicted phosphorylase